MWPHQFTIALGDTAVGIGTDDDQLAAALALWQISPDELLDPLRIDFGVEWHPSGPTGRGVPRPVPTNQHGSTVVGRATDIGALRDGLLRTLGAVVAPVPAGHVRLTGLPLLRDGAIELVSPGVISRLSHRGLLARGFTPIYVPGVVIDPIAMRATIAAPWGTDAAAIVAPLRRWWAQLPALDGEHSLSPGQLVAHVAERIAAPMMADHPVVIGYDRDLAALVQLVDQLPPTTGWPGE